MSVYRTIAPLVSKGYNSTGMWYIYTVFFIHLYVPFKIISAHMRRANQKVGRKWENPEKNHLAYLQAELGLSHVARSGLEPTPDTAVR